MTFAPPSEDELKTLLGTEKSGVWQRLCQAVEQRYAIVPVWGPGGKKWIYEYKYRKGGRTLCALYAGERATGFMVILGAAEREKFEAERAFHSEFVLNAYDSATTYHDGKWIMFEPEGAACAEELARLLGIKRKPDRK